MFAASGNAPNDFNCFNFWTVSGIFFSLASFNIFKALELSKIFSHPTMASVNIFPT
jgi:hypothetical protein